MLSGSLGAGTIAGVAAAIAVGGPGAIFWMWIIAVVGMMTKMVEVTLAVKYRSKGENGEYYGGPMHYIKKGLNKNGIPGRIICVCINDSGYYGCLFCAN